VPDADADADADTGSARREFQQQLLHVVLQYKERWWNHPGQDRPHQPASPGKVAREVLKAEIDGVEYPHTLDYAQRNVRRLLYDARGRLDETTLRYLVHRFEPEERIQLGILYENVRRAEAAPTESSLKRGSTFDVHKRDIVHDVVMRFYTDAQLGEARTTLENRYEEAIEPIIQRYLLDNGEGYLIKLPPELEHADRGLTNYLNFLEYLLFLESSNQIDPAQLSGLFDYWLNRLLRHPRYAALLVYLPLWDYELLADRYGITVGVAQKAGNSVAVYGSLREGANDHFRLGVDTGRCRLLGRSSVAGLLYEVSPDEADPNYTGGSYPCFVARDEPSYVTVEVYEVLDGLLWLELDTFEQFNARRQHNEYSRRMLAMQHADDSIDIPAAWVYVYDGQPDITREIIGGDWLAHLSEREVPESSSSEIPGSE
jgi:gamma-glutamylcyclotransferase (GGCT)/AIG2-like uncharacterized protein YtfP